MAKGSPRAPVMGPAFIRLLARLHEQAAPATAPVLSDQLAQWFDWNRAIVLSRALDGQPAPVQPPVPAEGGPSGECARVRANLTRLASAPLAADAAATDFAVVREHYLSTQRAMLTATGRLRGRLRDLLAGLSPAQARLAELDAVMEATLSPREVALLSTVPEVLEVHYLRLRDTAGASPDAPAGTWLDRFAQDMCAALLAELDFRFQPIQGLLAALTPRS